MSINIHSDSKFGLTNAFSVISTLWHIQQSMLSRIKERSLLRIVLEKELSEISLFLLSSWNV
ncbi:CLUMA_CG016935, isoform A [Clunio marinus]|uniref:CLUMA_CG016935, isoform A n=1 Tax=Clunio marinus TaxID=568069 RepID=A0A1J1IU15_9DIPT|nr:CLUMA_CG016935, isoform A [Clunio marinus]